MHARDRMIVALDVPTAAAAMALVDRLGDSVLWFKVGLELFTAEGPGVVRALTGRGKRVFLDLKLHDIPNTVAGAVRSVSRLGVDLLTVHAEGGPAMLRAAVSARNEAPDSALKLLGVTVLTSLDGTEYPEVYRSVDARSRVEVFARAAREAGMDGVVASALELDALVAALPGEFLKVIPGIRPAGTGAGDQARTATPAAALRAGASHLVVGRAITAAPDPPAAALEVLREMEGAG
jgi:orotidine-5'-phosphate decarboxylase